MTEDQLFWIEVIKAVSPAVVACALALCVMSIIREVISRMPD